MGQIDISAGVEIRSVSDFYDPLAAEGAWVNVQPYGRCWHPAHVEADWRPYCNGHWEWTDVGWYWVSDEPWSWACYHYGSWVDNPTYGWVWIPGTEWAPAWVVWRESSDYIGWAPYAPAGVVAAPFFVFTDVHHFRDHFHHRSDFIVNNTTIINKTKVVNRFHRERRGIDGVQRTVYVNEGPGVAPIQRATGATLKPTPVRDVIRQTPMPSQFRQRLSPTGTERRELRHESPPPPTGREQQRVFPQNPPEQTPRPPAVPERPTRPSTPGIPAPATPPERKLPPTSRGREITPPPTQVAPRARGEVGRTPVRPEGPTPQKPDGDPERRDREQQ